jgi:hypothetical protein
MERPDLARQMKCIAWHDVWVQLTDAERRVVGDYVVRLGAPLLGSAVWDEYGAYQTQFTLQPLEVVLVHAPNLERLEINVGYNRDLYLIPELKETRQPILTKLRSIRVGTGTRNFEHEDYDCNNDEDEVSLETVDHFINAAYNLNCLILPSTIYNSYFPTTPLTNLRRLIFEADSRTDTGVLAVILSNSPNLEFPALSWKPPYAYDAGYGGIPSLWDAIHRCHNSLRELRLHIDIDLEDRDLESGPPDSLRDFRRLEVLKVNNDALMMLYNGWKKKNSQAGGFEAFLSSMLPPVIREVTFWSMGGSMRRTVQRFARIVALGVYRHLKTVTFARSEVSPQYDWYAGDRDYSNEEWAGVKRELREECAKGGASFKWDLEEYDRYWGWDMGLVGRRY